MNSFFISALRSPLVIITSLAFLSGCSSSLAKKEAEKLAVSQTNKISHHLPVKDGAYTLVLAKYTKNAVKMLFVHDQDEHDVLLPPRFTEMYQRRMCDDPVVRTLLNKGIIYEVTVNNLHGSILKQMQVDPHSCGLAIT